MVHGGLFATLIDDAAVFPPGSAALPDALDAHRRLRQSPACTSIGPLLVQASALPALLELLEDPAEPIAIGIIGAPGDAAALVAATQLAIGRDGLSVVGVEIAAAGRPLDDLLTDLAPLSGTTGEQLGVALEIERGRPEQLEVVATLRDRLPPGRLRGKYRTGGVEPGSVPSAAELASVLVHAVRLNLPIKLTAGLHHAVRTTTQHGVLNVLLAVDAAFDQPSRVPDWLEQDDPGQLVGALNDWDDIQVARARSIFTSFGCCGVLEPLTEAARLGVIGRVAHDLTLPKECR